MRRLVSAWLCCGLLLTAGVAAAADDDDAAKVSALVADAAAACGAIETATYGARVEWRYTPDDEPSVSEGVVRWKKWGSDAPAVLAGSTLRADIRMDLADGVVYAFRAGDLSLLLPAREQVLIVTKEVGGERWITGNMVEGLVVTPLLDPARFERFGEGDVTLSYEGIEAAGGVACHVLTAVRPGDAAYQDVRETYFLGVDDHLPRRYEESGLRNGERSSKRILLTDLVTGVDVPDDAFTLKAPEGYVVEHHVPKPLPELLAVGSEAPDWTLVDPEGNERSLADYRGRLVVLDFWGTWCNPCLLAMPGLQRVHEEFVERGVAVVGISCREREEADPAGVMESKGLTYELLLDGDDVAKAYHVTSYPTLYVIGKDGTILASDSGYYEGAEHVLSSVLDQHL